MYFNAKGVALAVSAAWTGYPASSSAAETQTGSAQNDLFNGAGGDTLVGGLGDDSYNLWDAASQVVEQSAQGVDTAVVQYWGPAQLAANVENMVLSSPGANSGTGNGLDNVIIAGTVGASLNGGAGDDVLVGGAGADVFKIIAGNGSDAIVGFTTGKDAIQLQGYGFSTFAQLKAAASQVGSDVQVNLGGGETLVVRDIALGNLNSYDFGFRIDPPAPQSGSVFLDGARNVYSAKGWYVLNNTWNPGNSIDVTYKPADLTGGTTFNWDYPATTDLYPAIRGFPEVIFGPAPLAGGLKSTDTAGVFPIKVSELTGLTADYDVSFKGNTGGFNVAYDIWLTKEANGGPTSISNEVMVWVHKGSFDAYGAQVGTYSDANFSGKIYHEGTYTAIVADHDVPAGKVDITAIFAKLQALGILSGNEYLASVELGAEVTGGVGSLTINNLDLTVSSRASNGGTTVALVTGSGVTTTTIPAEVAHPSASSTLSPSVEAPPSASLAVSGLVLNSAVENDTLMGGAGNDILHARGGSNYLRGGDGDDQIDGGAGFDDINGNRGADVAHGGSGNDWVVGGQDSDVLYGDDGDDVVYGNLGSDTLVGGAGADMMRGGQDNDVLNGGDGRDWLSGDRGDDTVTGGGGADVFHISTGAGVDRVTDFNVAEGDKVQLDAGTAYTAHQVGADVVIDIAGGQMILMGVQMSSLGQDWLSAS